MAIYLEKYKLFALAVVGTVVNIMPNFTILIDLILVIANYDII